MSYFELEKNTLLQISDEELEELVARLAEAEVAANGGNVSDVTWSGHINAPDGGVDVHVNVSVNGFNSGFLPRTNTVFQVKKHEMPVSKIRAEICPGGVLSESIAEQAQKSGAYILVSLEDDCSPPMHKARLKAMRVALDGNPNKDSIHLDFYDRSKLHQWLRQHPGVTLWLRPKVGQPLSGWQPYGRWSNTPAGVDDTLIMDKGVSVMIPIGHGDRLTIQEAIPAVRDLIRETGKSIRIIGLSGVGKTRFVQALFDETVGVDPLDRTRAIYVDTGADPDPSARSMVERLIEENRSAIVVLDNCPSSLHSALASRVSGSGAKLKLITVEYDIREDNPQTTEVVRIETNGPDTAEQLLLIRYPGIGHTNAHKISEFADGNAKVSLALAERVKEDETLASLTDAELFDRLFQQRNEPDGELRKHAEVLSLVYSYAVEQVEDGTNDLAVLGGLINASLGQLYRSTSTLLERQVAQKRGRWRAILPHAIANRLASSALNSIHQGVLKTMLENPANRRLLKSFAHRLGIMHDHAVAQGIVRDWLSPEGLLANIAQLDDDGARILEYVAPVAPAVVLDRIETWIYAPDFTGMDLQYSTPRTMIINLLVSLAYEPAAFDRCARLLIRIADFEDSTNSHSYYVRDRIIQLFQPYRSGTHATLDQREAVLREMLVADDPKRRELGLKMLSTALGGPSWTGMGIKEFGAHPRDFGYSPDYQQLVDWHHRFIDVAVDAGLDDDRNLSNGARVTLAQKFRWLWRQSHVRKRLVEAARVLNEHQYWAEGRKAVRATIHFDYRGDPGENEPNPIPAELAGLKNLLEPKDLIDRITVFVFGRGHDSLVLDDESCLNNNSQYEEAGERLAQTAESLGEEFARLGIDVGILGNELFIPNWASYRVAFGRGLATGSKNLCATWKELVEAFANCEDAHSYPLILSGFIENVEEHDRPLSRRLLDQAAENEKLQRFIVDVHPIKSFSSLDLERCMKVLKFPGVGPKMYSALIWHNEYQDLPTDRILKLSEILLEKEGGDSVLVDALSLKLHGTDPNADFLGTELRRIGLLASSTYIRRNPNGSEADHSISAVVENCLTFCDNEIGKDAWLDAIFSLIDQDHVNCVPYEDVVQVTVSLMLEPFLDRVFDSEETTQNIRVCFLEQSHFDGSPLARVDADRLIAWCQTRNDPTVWQTVGEAIDCLKLTEDNQFTELTELGLRFLGACPNPEQVMDAYAGKITPMSWSGSRAEKMEKRAAAFKPLVNHSNRVISNAARRVIDQAANWIEIQRSREQRADEAREQTFE